MDRQEILTEAGNYYEKLLETEVEKGYDHGWSYYKLKEKYGVEVANKIWSRADSFETW